MSKNFKKLLLANSHLPMKIQRKNLQKAFREWKGKIEQTDDVCIMGIKI